MRIGTLKQTQKERINFRTWIKNYWNGKEVELDIIRIFLPGVYNNFTLIMDDDENNLEIRRTLSTELGKQLIRDFKLSTKKITEGVLLLKIDREGNQDIIYRHTPELGYEFRKNCFVLVDLKNKKEEEEDLPF
jgi:hypothetical protein